MYKHFLRNIIIISAFVIFLFTLDMVLQKAHERGGNDPVVRIGNAVVSVEVAATEASRKQGLSGRLELAVNSGMLFVFDDVGMWGFWMKDMSFTIDIIWADDSGRVVTIAQNVSADTYPQVFRPIAPAKYVLEVPAGFVATHSIKEGSVMSLPTVAQKHGGGA